MISHQHHVFFKRTHITSLKGRSRGNFPVDRFFFEFLLQSVKNWGSPTSVQTEIKRVENFPDFEKLLHVIQHGL